MNKARNRYYKAVPGPTRTTWPPLWMNSPVPSSIKPTEPEASELRNDEDTTNTNTSNSCTPPNSLPSVQPLSPAVPWNLSADLREQWEERAAIMYFDGGVPWPECETAALEDVLRNAKCQVATSDDDGLDDLIDFAVNISDKGIV